jgi:hypothetical protein
MTHAEEMRKIADHIISSYETRIQSIGTLFETTHQILQTFQDSLLDTREERERLNGELRENLAKNRSLRKRDFDNMMQNILLIQDQREKEVRNLLNRYLTEQKEMSRGLRRNLIEFRDSLIRGEVQRVKEFQEMFKEIFNKHERRREEVTAKLKEFKREQHFLTSKLRGLLAKGKELRIRDLKLALQGYKARFEEGLGRQTGIRKEVHPLPDEYKKRGKESFQQWRIMENRLAQMN